MKNRTDREVHTGYFVPKVEIKDYNPLFNGRNLSDQPVKNDQMKYFERLKDWNIRKTTTG